MIDYIRGEVIQKTPTLLVIQCNGIGYEIHISLNTFSRLKESTIKIFTHLVIREDAHLLYGFLDPEERTMFRRLITVSGIGVNTARMILSSLSAYQLQQAILNNEVHLLTGVKGIGAKTAQRLILDLKDKIGSLLVSQDTPLSEHNQKEEETIQALEVLGYQRKTSKVLINKLMAQDNNLTVEELVKQALNNL